MTPMPIFMVGIVFGPTMDYKVFIATRIREAYGHGDQPRESVVSGFRASARVVVAAAPAGHPHARHGRPGRRRGPAAPDRDPRADHPFRAASEPGAAASPERLAELTAREREVMVLAAQGYSNSEIAEQLFVSPLTARTHIQRAMMKLGARDRAQPIVIAYQTGLVQPTPPAQRRL